MLFGVVLLGGSALGISSGIVDASGDCASGGTCLFKDSNFSSSSFRNTSGVDSNLTDNKFGDKTPVNDNTSAIANSTTSTTFSGVDLFRYSNCDAKLVWPKRGYSTKVKSSTMWWNDQISSFKLSKPGIVSKCS